MSVRGIAAGMAAMVLVLLPTELLAGGEWPDSPNKAWFENLQRPDNDKNPHRQADPKSLFCCGVADTRSFTICLSERSSGFCQS
jgi:hypothetical protein